MNALLNVNIVNPHFTPSIDSMFSAYGKIAKDLANSLHQVTNFVRFKLSIPNIYGLRTNNNKVVEKLGFKTELGGSLSILLVQDSTDYDFFTVNKVLSKESIMQSFDYYLSTCKDKELKNLAEYYRVFLNGLSSGTIYGCIFTEENSLVIGIGKYDAEFNKIRTVIQLNQREYYRGVTSRIN